MIIAQAVFSQNSVKILERFRPEELNAFRIVYRLRYYLLKLRFSEKITKIKRNLSLIYEVAFVRGRLRQIFVHFSEYMNFNSNHRNIPLYEITFFDTFFNRKSYKSCLLYFVLSFISGISFNFQDPLKSKKKFNCFKRA